MSRPKLARRQSEFFEWIAHFIRKHGRSPTLQELGEHFGMKPQSADNIVRPLIRKGYLQTTRKGPVRTLIVLDESGSEWHPNRLPVIGKVAAGTPILAIENRIGSVTLDETFLKKGATFALAVQGDSMIDAGILPGDKVIIRQQSTAETGQIALVLLDDFATIKRYYPLPDGKIRLKPENPNHHELIVPAGNCQVQGVVIGLYRELE